MTRPISAAQATRTTEATKAATAPQAAKPGESDSKKRYYRKNARFFNLIEKIKLWPSRAGVLHGVKAIAINGQTAVITTHCGETFTVRDSRAARAARWLRNKWYARSCQRCQVPDWKIAKYSATVLNQKWGASLTMKSEEI